ncbi:MAG: uracil-DNA glycosylase [Microcystis aeruginosa G13-07]|nr:uracil-DNA glycosylase [Microcystis aeruginosa G13-07]
MTDIKTLIKQVHQEAKKEDFPIDTLIYHEAKKDPFEPVLYAGNLASQLCFFGRDLGRDEVYAGQPLIGAAGRMVREGFFQAWQGRKSHDRQELLSVCDQIFLTNTVPYKPPGNKAYSGEVKDRFRPFIEKLLVFYWQGDHIITLGTEAFKWFEPYGKPKEVDKFYLDKERFTKKLLVTLTANDEDGLKQQKKVTLLPLPHPSPLNQRYYALFPDLLQKRLTEFAF